MAIILDELVIARNMESSIITADGNVCRISEIDDNYIPDMRIILRDLKWASESEEAAYAERLEHCTLKLDKRIKLTEEQGRRRLEKRKKMAETNAAHADREAENVNLEAELEDDDRRADAEMDKLCNMHQSAGEIQSARSDQLNGVVNQLEIINHTRVVN